ncbi:MAG: helix-turn-helix protein [Rubritepida sp.]|nr:helix-turn-helix protein [Rubritepida sp.]
MQLSLWLSQAKMTDAEFAAAVGRDQATINRTRRGLTMPGPSLVARIVAVTKGEVQPADIYAAYTGRHAVSPEPVQPVEAAAS